MSDVGPREVVDGNVVGAAKGVESRSVEAVEVHRDIGAVAGRTDVVRRDVDFLVEVGGVEENGIDAGLALDHVAAVAGVPLEDVVAGAQMGDVVAAVAVDEVVIVAAEEWSLPSPPVILSLPPPPSMVRQMRPARPLPAVNASSPPLALMTMFSIVPASMWNGAGTVRSTLTRMPSAVMVKVSAPLPPLTSRVSTPSPPSSRRCRRPGSRRSDRCRPRRRADRCPAAGEGVVAVAAEQQIVPAFPGRMSLPAWPNSRSVAEPPVKVSLPSPPNSGRWAVLHRPRRVRCYRHRPGQGSGSGRCW